MPATRVVYFKDGNGRVPAVEWLDEQLDKVQDKIIVRTEQLEEKGHELRRPLADFLRDGIYELRAKHLKVNYRLLYFFHVKDAVISHGLTKEDKVPDKEINTAIANKKTFAGNPEKHTFEGEEE